MPWTEDDLIDVVDGEHRPKKSKAAPALDGAISSTFLLMVHLGDTADQIWFATLPRGSSTWGPDRQAGSLRAEAAPAVARGLMLFPENQSGQLWQATFSAGTWAVDAADPEAKGTEGNDLAPPHVRPALARSADGWHLVIKSPTSTRINHAYRRELRWQGVGNLGDEDRGLYLTKTRPAIAMDGTTLHVLHLGEGSNQIYHARGTVSFDGQGRATTAWREKQVGGQLTKATPAVAMLGGRLHMVHLGDTSSDLWHSIYVPELDSWTQDRIEGQQSKAPPALAAFDGTLHMVHLGETSNQIWWSRWTG